MTSCSDWCYQGESAQEDQRPVSHSCDNQNPISKLTGPESRIAKLVRSYGLRMPAESRLWCLNAIEMAATENRDVLPFFLSRDKLLVAPPPNNRVSGSHMGCAGCLALRWQKLRSQPERDLLERDGGKFESIGVNPMHQTAYLEATALLMVERALTGEVQPSEPHGFSMVQVLALDTGLMQLYPLVPDAHCYCAERPVDSAELAILNLQPREIISDRSARCKSLEEIDLSFDALANPVCGVLGKGMLPDTLCTTTAPVTGSMMVRGSWMLHDFYWSGHANDYASSARVALLEGLERHAGLTRCRQKSLKRSSRRALEGIGTLDPRDCALYDEEFYRREPFFVSYSDELEMNWVWGFSLRDKSPLLVPERLVYYLDQDVSSNFVQECSNGCAAGANLEEAILYGLLELIERDAFLIGWYGGAHLPEIKPESVPDQALQFMMARMRYIGYDVRLFDNRIDFDIPVVTALAVNRNEEALGQVALASGASVNPIQAISSALCEIASYIPSFTKRVHAVEEEVIEMSRDYERVRELAHHPLLFGLPSMKPQVRLLLDKSDACRFDEVYADWEMRKPKTRLLLDLLNYCLQRVFDAGYDVIIVEQTSPEQEFFGLRNVCVICPGLVPIDFGWNKQRVLGMPRVKEALIKSGLKSCLLETGDMHRVPHPFP